MLSGRLNILDCPHISIYTDEAREVIAQLEGLAEQQYVDPYNVAMAYDGLGDIDRAVSLLEQGYAEKSPSMYSVRIEFWSDALRADPRFQDIVRRMDFPEEM